MVSTKEYLTADEQKFIIDHFQAMSDQELADKFKKHRVTITRFRIKSNLYKDTTSSILTKNKETSQNKKEELKIKTDAADKLGVINKKEWRKTVGISTRKEEVKKPSVETPKKVEATSKETSSPAEILFKRDKQRTWKEVEKLLPSELWEDTKGVVDKFIMLKKSLREDEWHIFLSHWIRYLKTYKNLIEVDEDFDDLVGIIREHIIQDRVFRDTKGSSTGLSVTTTKQYNESVKRMQDFKKSFENHIDKRRKERQVGAHAFTEIVKLFDSDEARKAMIAADKADYEELWPFIKQVQERMDKDKAEHEEGLLDGNEEALMLGITKERIEEVVQRSHDILSTKKLDEVEKIEEDLVDVASV